MNLIGNWRIRKSAVDSETVYISEKFGVRSLHIGSDTVQSAMRIAKPNELELSYTRSMMGFLLFNNRPESVLVLGLGGGSVAKFVYNKMPWTSIRVIELRERVLTVARRYFHVPENDARFETIVGDAAEFVTRDDTCADLMLIDGYDAESHVAALSNLKFYRDCRAHLNRNGMVAINLWGGDREFYDTLKRIEEAFPAGVTCLPAEKPGNVIVFAFRDHTGSVLWSALEHNAAALASTYELDFPRFVAALRKLNRHDDTYLYLT
jgi:spermidine synthase